MPHKRERQKEEKKKTEQKCKGGLCKERERLILWYSFCCFLSDFFTTRVSYLNYFLIKKNFLN